MKKGCLIVAIILIIVFFGSLVVTTSNRDEVRNNRWFEIEGKNGIVRMHLGMPKDSVILLLGTPDYARSYSSGDDIVEDIGYYIKNDKIPDLSFTFENGEMEKFIQH